MDLKTLLDLVIGGGAIGAATYVILKAWPAFEALPDPVVKRAITMGASAVLAVAAWLVAIWLGYYPAPAPDAKAWVEAVANVIIALGAAGFTASQAIHAKDIRK